MQKSQVNVIMLYLQHNTVARTLSSIGQFLIKSRYIKECGYADLSVIRNCQGRAYGCHFSQIKYTSGAYKQNILHPYLKDERRFV